MAFKDRDEFLDALYEHLFEGEDDPDDDWFTDRVEGFFNKHFQFSGNEAQNTSRRRQRNSGGNTGGNSTAKPPRRRKANGNNEQSTYGSSFFFGS